MGDCLKSFRKGDHAGSSLRKGDHAGSPLRSWVLLLLMILPAMAARDDRDGLDAVLGGRHYLPLTLARLIRFTVQGMLAIAPAPFWLGLVLLVTAIVLLSRAAGRDQRNWVIAKATPMPLGFVNPRDDVWVSGRIECATPLVLPEFDKTCVYYEYEEVEYEAAERFARGMRVVARDDRRVSFDLVAGNRRITVVAREAVFADLWHAPKVERGGRWIQARYLPCPGFVEVLGSVSEDRQQLQSYRNIPLIVAGQGREAYITSLERSKLGLRTWGTLALLPGLWLLLLGISLKLGLPPAAESGSTAGNFLLSLLVALTGFCGWWVMHTYNKLVTCREQVKTAWRQIEVDLKNRHELIPQLLEVVKRYAARQEQDLAKLTTELRYEGKSDVSGVAERWPELKADALFQKLATELTALEEKIAYGRKFYNDALLRYDVSRQKFPASIVAGWFGRFPSYEPFTENDQ